MRCRVNRCFARPCSYRPNSNKFIRTVRPMQIDCPSHGSCFYHYATTCVLRRRKRVQSVRIMAVNAA